MIVIVPFIPAHLKDFECIEQQRDIQNLFCQEYGEYLCQGEAYSVIVDGVVISMHGVLNCEGDRFFSWSLMSNKTMNYMHFITRHVNSFLDKFKGGRVETIVLKDFKQGHRWVKMLGFKNETPNGMEKYFNGKNYCLYSRVM